MPAGLSSLGRILVVIGAVMALVGVVLVVAERFRAPAGAAPRRHRGGASLQVHFPLGTSLILSVILSLVLWLVGRRG